MVQPADDVSSGALRFHVRTRRMFGMLPDEQVSLVSARGLRCKAKWMNPATSISGETSVEFVAVVPDDWFDPN